jgi:hypothetical protein
MKLRLPLFASTLALAGMMAVTSTTAFAAPAAAAAPRSSVTTSLSAVPSNGGTFTGSLSNIVFSNVNGVLTLTGNLTGTLTDAAGNVIATVNQTVTTAVTPAAASCPILSLTLGPLHLDLLGLVVDLNQVVLNITAQPGPGNLLGNLLCAVAHLLDNTGATTTAIANLLNMILGGL